MAEIRGVTAQRVVAAIMADQMRTSLDWLIGIGDVGEAKHADIILEYNRRLKQQDYLSGDLTVFTIGGKTEAVPRNE